jgi:hypothetical protein
MNIIEQRYDFLVDARSLEQLDGAMLKRLLFKLYKHKGWLFNYLYYKIDLKKFNASQKAILEECALHFYGKSLSGGVSDESNRVQRHTA